MLLEYLQDYTDRVKPLLDQNDLYGKVLTDFEKKWDSGTFPGWPVGSSVGPERHHSGCFCPAGASADLVCFARRERPAVL